MRIIVAIALAFVPYSAIAAPVYLKCQLDRDVGKEPVWDIALNEESGTVMVSFPGINHSYTARAIFTAEKVTFKGFTIDRTNFALERDMSDLTVSGKIPEVDRGRCELAQTKRAF